MIDFALELATDLEFIFGVYKSIGQSSARVGIGKTGNYADDVVAAEKMTTNLGKEIDITPSSNHSITTKNPGLKGTPNSSIDITDTNEIIKTRRWFDNDGKAIRDVDMTSHGNSKLHPEFPHEHNFEYNLDGSLKKR